MRTIAVLPVKSFGAAKQRLSGLLARGSRQALARAMFSDVLGTLRRVPGLDTIVVVTGDGVAKSEAVAERVQVLRDIEEAGQSNAVLIGIRFAVAAGYGRALLVPGDAPLLDPDELVALLERAHDRSLGLVVVPDRHGIGTNALLLSPPDAITPSFGPGSLERHIASARAAGVSHAVEEVPSLALDIDTPDDLAELSGLLETRRGTAPSTRGALRQLGRSKALRTATARPRPKRAAASA
jgi:2-phospho-L-lactate/phosphoenolpyruvate guanylyltransferase